jgi:hypothetical protein
VHWQLIRAQNGSLHYQLEQVALNLWGVKGDELRRLAE